MKKLLIALSALLLSLTFAQAEIQWSVVINQETTHKVGTLTQKHSENILRILESMPWIEEGSHQSKGKYLYIIYTPTSDESQKLYANTRNLLNEINIRWIPIQQGDLVIDGLYETRTPKALEDAMMRGILPTINNPQKTNLIANMAFTAFVYLRAGNYFAPEGQSYFPTVIYGNDEKLSIHVDPKDIKPLIQEIPITIPKTDHKTVEQLAKNSFNIYKVKEYAYFVNEEQSPAKIYLYPDEKGVYLGYLESALPIKAITDNGYIAIDLIDGQGRYIFIKYFNDDVEINHLEQP